ncbi:putative cyclic nucleotide-gated ion channel 13 [Phtheirospermum japonicum]|uniref:Putative cyclic nucleotide-gated ion channel 13 n=1 Tax=Phtheirospermum japonicum TaxID=374723 RepID=A0A830B2V2_9LAMI|nr:putative cyclic nucleotide-gated ion channel 13 [Phtheirospermum japonicum]
MTYPREKFVRFQDWRSENSFNEQGRLKLSRLRSAAYSFSEKFHRGFESGSDKIKRFTGSIRSFSLGKSRADEDEEESNKKIILDPQGSFLQKWNKVFVLTCMIAISLDPLFFYIPIINDEKKCLDLDGRLELAASILRSFTDIFYLIHIIFQFRTGFIAPSSRVFGRGVLVQDSWAIAKRYLASYFIIDILAVLPLPQIVILIIIPKLRGARSLNTKNLLKFVVIFQYIPRILRVYPLYREVTRTSGILTETAWAGAAFNLFLYMLASHILNNSCPIQNANATLFDFGIFLDALQSGIVETKDFPQKLFYCFCFHIYIRFGALLISDWKYANISAVYNTEIRGDEGEKTRR